MKRILSILCLAVIIITVAACRNKGDESSGDGGDTGVATINQAQNGEAGDNPTDSGAENQSQSGDTSGTQSGSEGIASSGGYGSINWDEHIDIDWWMIATVNEFYNSYNDNPVVKYLENRFNVSFRFEQPAQGTESDSLSLMMGTGRYTDVLELSTYAGSVSQLYDDGIIIDIAQWLDYMPNMSRLIDTVPEFARVAFDDAGRILGLPSYADDVVHAWSGLVYRHDILETMTGGNVHFPSGNQIPTTLADWEYMLPLFQAYFDMAGFADYGALILPAMPIGVFHFGELMSTFGGYYGFYVRDNVVRAGMLEPAMYEYVSTMRDWFEKGWIHQDFASRTDDMFFMPNPQLVFGGAAGAWFGMAMHLGDRMSMPDYGLFMDVRPMPSPLADGITQRDMLRRRGDLYGGSGFGNAFYAGSEHTGRILAILDHMYSDEGGLLRVLGLRADEIPPGYTLMDQMGLSDGVYWYDVNGNIVINPLMDEMGGSIGRDWTNGIRLPGFEQISIINALRSEEMLQAHNAWSGHDEITEVLPLPDQLSLTTEESTTVNANDVRMRDYTDQMLAMFIMGTTPLNDSVWEEFLDQLRAFGIEENQAIWQAAYDRFMARGQ